MWNVLWIMQNGDMGREMSQGKKTFMYVWNEVLMEVKCYKHTDFGTKKQLFSVLEFYLAPTNINWRFYDWLYDR